jgi:hypothetical protein
MQPPPPALPCPRPGGCAACWVARLRRQFLKLIDFNVSITASLYASYYFELRTLCEKAELGFTFKPLSEAQQRKLEINSDSRQKELQVSKRWKSEAVSWQFWHYYRPPFPPAWRWSGTWAGTGGGGGTSSTHK